MASADKESVSSATARRVRRFMARPEAVSRLRLESLLLVSTGAR